ncbi:DUF6931 family protein [Sulfitobacter sabulilitoris]|uniref:Uncharacterized protein n=1 Tax=Sulfitobacter sabulilitoris TaxID=2562655 RepID=A0A5S3PNP7_9RHOB|nr:hypothetical protein [Sulfitobacter sabulilitoris]TMM54135.1 hypothetical protein FDT80_00580 [Sulfitobacter sabulilitoris]
MTQRFDDLRKVPDQPAVRLLALANAKLMATLGTPASASVSEVMTALDAQGAYVDMLRLMSVALPPRERTWWACLAARDLIGPVDKLPRPLELSEDWVRKPSDATRAAARDAIDLADMDDDTVLCATSVIFCDDTLGPGDLAQYAAPPGAASAAVFAMNVTALDLGDDVAQTAAVLIDRALDIARGGNGQLPLPVATQAEETAP